MTLGGVSLTAQFTPGHTRGATTWTMEVTDPGRGLHVVFFSSLTIHPETKLHREPSYLESVPDYENTFARLKTMPCDIFFAPHGGQFAMAKKFARLERGDGVDALIDPDGWRTLLTKAEKTFRDQLATEQATSKRN